MLNKSGNILIDNILVFVIIAFILSIVVQVFISYKRVYMEYRKTYEMDILQIYESAKRDDSY